jgi:hypothetical protein
MNNSEFGKLILEYAKLSAYYAQDLSDSVLKMYCDDLVDLDFSTVSTAMSSWRLNPKNNRMPLPAQIRQMVCPEIDQDSVAREIASRVIAAVSKFGYTDPNGAKEYIGETGWEIVRRFGGWQYICENLGVTLDLTMLTAQVRDLAKVHSTYSQENLQKKISNGYSDVENKLLSIVKPKMIE